MAIRYPMITRVLRHGFIDPGLIQTVRWCQKKMAGIACQPWIQLPHPLTNASEGQNQNKGTRNRDREAGDGGGLRARRMLRKKPAREKRVSPANHAMRLRELRVTM